MPISPNISLRERIQDYQDRAEIKLLPKVPVVIIVSGRSFSKTTSLLEKPFSSDLLECFCAALIKLTQEIQGSIFGYHYNDQLIIIARNDQHSETQPWLNNSAQALASMAASIATLEFERVVNSKNINLIGSGLFTATAFVLPGYFEIINALIHYQQDCFQHSLSLACFYELIKTRDKIEANKIIANKNPKEKAELLLQECQIEYNNYPLPFKRGVACIKVPSSSNKNKLILDMELPLFSQEKEWLFKALESTGCRLEMLN